MWVLIFLTVGGHCARALFTDDGDKVVSNNRNGTNVGQSKPNVVNTTYGEVQGIIDDDGDVLQFFDVPYGNFSENPLQEPVKPDYYKVTLNRTDHSVRCPQMDGDVYYGDHNCLTLSIFKAAPENGTENGTENEIINGNLSAVLFHIHDSSFSTGSGDPLVYGPKYLVENDIILVLPNYRLGVLGFLCLQNMSAPGNAALKDLTFALDWTKENIINFGGDPNNIVVSGAGTGGALAELLLISNVSRPYISRAITESGFSLSPWAIDRNPLATASSLPLLLDIDIEQLVRNTSNIEFRPCIEIESGFITESPWILLRRNQTGTKLAYMTGIANHAAWGEAVRQTAIGDSLSELNKNPTLLLPNDLIFENNEEKSRIARQVRSFYFGGRDYITRTDVNQLSQLFTDTGYLNSGLRGARLLVEAGVDVYFYEYSFNNPDLMQAFDASTRGDSLAFVFSRSGETTTNVTQTAMRHIMTSLWANFIKNGQPSADNIGWSNMKVVAPAEEEWLSIGASVEMQKGLHVNRLRLWQDIYDKHFIDNSPGFVRKPSIYILVSGLSILTRLGVSRA